MADLPPPEPIEDFRLENVVCHESLGGLLNHSQHKAVEGALSLRFPLVPSPAARCRRALLDRVT